MELCHEEPGVERVGQRALWEKEREREGKQTTLKGENATCSQTYANLGSDSKTAIGFTPVFSSAKENNIT